VVTLKGSSKTPQRKLKRGLGGTPGEPHFGFWRQVPEFKGTGTATVGQKIEKGRARGVGWWNGGQKGRQLIKASKTRVRRG